MTYKKLTQIIILYIILTFSVVMDFSHILQPTRVTKNTATVIDNIFSNNIKDSISCGNILLTLSEHFSQFLSIKREKTD